MEEEKNEVLEAEVKQGEVKKDRKGIAIAALILGIISLVLFCIWFVSVPCGIAAIILGILGIKSTKKGMAIAGLITGIIGMLISIVIVISVGVGIFKAASEITNSVNYDDYYNSSYDYDDSDYDYDYDFDYDY